MKTEKEIDEKIAEIEAKEDSYLMNGGGGVPNPYPYDALIELLEWVKK